ncbi:MAG: GrpB family protein [Elainellaceae cyanobacterium]
MRLLNTTPPTDRLKVMDNIVLHEYDPEWAALFNQESLCLRAVLERGLLTRIEHFGSTAVPGLAAKPIVDMLVGVDSLERAKRTAVSPLEQMGYAYWHDNPDPKRMLFVKGLPPNGPRTHHIHMAEPDSVLWERLIFRDYLCHHPEEASRYEQLKRQLAQRFSSDREAYTEGKTEHIALVMQRARRWLGGQTSR